MEMSFEEAKKWVIPFGKYETATLEETAETDEGLLYLDWLVGERRFEKFFNFFMQALKRFVQEPEISEDIEAVLKMRED